MNRVFYLLILAALLCGSPAFASGDLAEAFNSTPAVKVDIDGSHKVDVCHGNRGRQQEVAPQSNDKEEVSFEKQSDFDAFSIGVCVVAGVLAAGLAVYTSVKQEVNK